MMPPIDRTSADSDRAATNLVDEITRVIVAYCDVSSFAAHDAAEEIVTMLAAHFVADSRADVAGGTDYRPPALEQ